MSLAVDQAYHDGIAQRFDASYTRPGGQAYTEAFTRRILGLCPVGRGDRVLDVGCGTGRFTLEVARQSGAEVVGIDTSHGMVELARRNVGGAAVVHHSRDGRIPYELGEFDLVFCFGVLHHAVGEGDPFLTKTLGEMARVSRGHVLAIEPNKWNPYFFATTWLWHGLQEVVSGYPRVDHERPLTLRAMRRAMTACGVQVNHAGHASPLGSWTPQAWGGPAQALLDGPLRFFSTHNVVLGNRQA